MNFDYRHMCVEQVHPGDVVRYPRDERDHKVRIAHTITTEEGPRAHLIFTDGHQRITPPGLRVDVKVHQT